MFRLVPVVFAVYVHVHTCLALPPLYTNEQVSGPRETEKEEEKCMYTRTRMCVIETTDEHSC